MSENFEVTIQTKGGDIKISRDEVKKYLCPAATDGEIYQFLNMAKGFKLNPWLREIYLVKSASGNYPASYVVSKDSFMKRAESHPQYQGFRAGVVIVDKGTQQITEREGSIVLDTEVLIGGWAEVYRKDWKNPGRSQVSLKEYAKNQSTWNSMKATMIRKVGIVQAMRETFIEELSGMYTEDELKLSGETAAGVQYEVADGLLNEISELGEKVGKTEGEMKMLLGKYKGNEATLKEMLIKEAAAAEVIAKKAFPEAKAIEVEPAETQKQKPSKKQKAQVQTSLILEEPKIEINVTKESIENTATNLLAKRESLLAEIAAYEKFLPKHNFTMIRSQHGADDSLSMEELRNLYAELKREEIIVAISLIKIEMTPEKYNHVRVKYPAKVSEMTTETLSNLRTELEGVA